jgi:hypothetical protein
MWQRSVIPSRPRYGAMATTGGMVRNDPDLLQALLRRYQEELARVNQAIVEIRQRMRDENPPAAQKPTALDSSPPPYGSESFRAASAEDRKTRNQNPPAFDPFLK